MHPVVQLPDLGARWRQGAKAIRHIDVSRTTIRCHAVELEHPISITPKVRLEFDHRWVEDIADIVRRIGDIVPTLARRYAGSIAMIAHQKKRARAGFLEDVDRFIVGADVVNGVGALNDQRLGRSAVRDESAPALVHFAVAVRISRLVEDTVVSAIAAVGECLDRHNRIKTGRESETATAVHHRVDDGLPIGFHGGTRLDVTGTGTVWSLIDDAGNELFQSRRRGAGQSRWRWRWCWSGGWRASTRWALGRSGSVNHGWR